MIDRIVQALKLHGLFVDSRALEPLENWQGRVQTDNRLLEAGDIFVCIKGEKFDGHRFIQNALVRGASLIVSQEEMHGAYSCIRVTDTRKAAAVIVRIVLLPAKLPFTIIGVTGTNGKTTTSLILYEALRNMGYKCGWIGTLGYYVDGEEFSTQHTTPDIIELNTIFKSMADRAILYVIMEVSSHALSLDRVYGVEFQYCLFSNLSREHLDFHGNMEAYKEAKYLLFDRGAKTDATAIVNTADPFGEVICKRLTEQHAACYRLGGDHAQFSFKDVVTEISHSSFTLSGSGKELHINSRLIGGFNVQNLGLVAVTLCAMGFPNDDIEAALRDVHPVKGRIQKVDNPHNIGVFIDYAHTPDALENLLKSVEELPHNRIICLFGAGGDRDKGKRPLMLKAALKHSDAVIVTDDNPRTEAPDSIIRDIVIDCDLRLPWWIIRDRKAAIEASINLAQPGDLVLICGKGHETYQEIEGIRHHFDDHEEALHALGKWRPQIAKADDELLLPVDETMLDILYSEGKEMPSKGYIAPKHYRYISTDTRSLKPGSVFYAIMGKKFDGHNFIPMVLEDSHNFVICDHHGVKSSTSDSLIGVENALQGLGLICQKYLQMFAPKRIAITGSTGKTSSKELIARILEDDQPTLKTLHNENNLLGLCKTILRIQPSHRYAIFELGTNHFGEIALLADIVVPDIAIILNIGPSHLEFLIDEEGVFMEKSALFKRPLAMKLYPGDDTRFEGITDGISVGYGDNCRYQITDQVCHTETQSFMLAGYKWELPYPAPHFATNAAFAIVLGLLNGVSQENIHTSLLKPINLAMRLQIVPRGSGSLIIDCYNANPSSMQKALEFWQQVQPDKPHYAILGDMLELGESSPMYHQMIGAMLVEMVYTKLVTVGELSRYYHHIDDPNPLAFNAVEELLASQILCSLPDESVVLVKASHGIHLEQLIPYLEGAE